MGTIIVLSILAAVCVIGIAAIAWRNTPMELTRKTFQYDENDPDRKYKETLFEMSIAIWEAFNNAAELPEGERTKGQDFLVNMVATGGRTNLMSEAIYWTDQFEKLYADEEWIDRDWWETIDEFVQQKLIS